MRKSLLVLAMLVAAPAPLFAQPWSLGVGAGPFIFGRFAERSAAIGTETGHSVIKTTLSATSRVGAEADVQRDLNEHFSVRLEGSWTQSPLRIKSPSGSGGVPLDAGRVNLTTLVAPLVLRINPRGALQFHLMAGPAYALYNVHNRVGGGETFSLFNGTRGRWGGAAGVGVVWWWGRRFGVEWQAQYIVTASPFRATDLAPSSQGVQILKPQNGHTTIGIRYRF